MMGKVKENFHNLCSSPNIIRMDDVCGTGVHKEKRDGNKIFLLGKCQ